jgi:hypothetical protein
VDVRASCVHPASPTWPLCCTSCTDQVNNTNRLLSSDNKGYAALVTELAHNPGELPGKGSFVAAFPSTNLGDVSPNTNGVCMCASVCIVPVGVDVRVDCWLTTPPPTPCVSIDPLLAVALWVSRVGCAGTVCSNSGLPCDFYHSTCDGRNEYCVGEWSASG